MNFHTANISNGFSLIEGRDSVSVVFQQVQGGFKELSHENTPMVMLTGGGKQPEVLVGPTAIDAKSASHLLRLSRLNSLRRAWANLQEGDLDILANGQFDSETLQQSMNYLSALTLGAEWQPRKFVSEDYQKEELTFDQCDDDEADLMAISKITSGLDPKDYFDTERNALGDKIKCFEPYLFSTPALIPRFEMLKDQFNSYDRVETSALQALFSRIVTDHAVAVMVCSKTSKPDPSV